MFKITRIHVKNFRSIREGTFELKDLQLLIGPNNSGKSNLLRVFEFLNSISTTDGINEIDIEKIRFQHKEFHARKLSIDQRPDPVVVTVEFNDPDLQQWYYYKIELFHLNKNSGDSLRDVISNSFVGIRADQMDKKEFIKINLLDTGKLRQDFECACVERNNTLNLANDSFKDQINNPYSGGSLYNYELLIAGEVKVQSANHHFGHFLSPYSGPHALDILKSQLHKIFTQFIIYKPDTTNIKLPVIGFPKEQFVEGNCRNIVPYLESLLSSNVELSAKLNVELNRCIPDFISYNFETRDTFSKSGYEGPVRYLRLKDRFGVDHLAEDVSEGTLYFLMLLAIINQKNIPPVLMLEEPETGIHPRRIAEIMEYIFKLREEYSDLSIILTTHHPYVVDHFSDLKDRVWVFDSVNGETKIENLERDIIEPSNARLKGEGEEPIDYSSSLGEHWAMGFLGGVPKPISY